MAKKTELERRVERDRRAAEVAAAAARAELAKARASLAPADALRGVTEFDRSRIDYEDRREASLEAIAANPFQAMVEVSTEIEGEDGDPVDREQLWYANEASGANQVLKLGDQSVVVLGWTHPGLQLALACDLGDYRDVRANGYRLLSVEPLAKARFDKTVPEVSALYQPGGAVRPADAAAPRTGLKAVKLGMTRDQVTAFVSRMSGLMVVTGAPGSGKTTVAFQRIRFLYDQQDQRQAGGRLVPYSPGLTRVFLANENLADQAKTLLSGQLDVPASVVRSVDAFVAGYLDESWLHKGDARPRQRKLPPLEAAARAAILGLSDHHDLRRLWKTYEEQVIGRLADAGAADWLSLETGRELANLASSLVWFGERATSVDDPLKSRVTMHALFTGVSRAYDTARASLRPRARASFDEAFQRWLYQVYDPLDALAAYFGSRLSEAALRIRRGTGFRADDTQIIARAIEEWKGRGFGPEDRPWLAWLLRFALPEASDPKRRFREMPSSIAPATHDGDRWTHVAIDEAQDLCVAEASLLGSLVDPDGALTVSADFRQIVSPVHGMVNAKALQVGRSLRGQGAEQIYPFAKNMRQSCEIGRFLRGFYEIAFKERPTFEPSATIRDKKPQLIIAEPKDHALRIKQLAAALRRSDVVRSVAVLQVNEDEEAMLRLRAELEALEVPLAPAWAATGEWLLTTSVERIKGLEFDACVVLGLEDVESASLNFTLNRAYVALSRPARRLALLASEFPSILRKVDHDLFDVTRS